ncbi:hypothetical protein PFISCL1PPCAC_19459, partial [Pristionchus fissidentatus]
KTAESRVTLVKDTIHGRDRNLRPSVKSSAISVKEKGIERVWNHVVSEDEASLHEIDFDEFECYAVECQIRSMIGSIPVNFELDTGSGYSIIGSQTWEALGRPDLQRIHRTESVPPIWGRDLIDTFNMDLGPVFRQGIYEA